VDLLNADLFEEDLLFLMVVVGAIAPSISLHHLRCSCPRPPSLYDDPPAKDVFQEVWVLWTTSSLSAMVAGVM
jgi:hypothetical protein